MMLMTMKKRSFLTLAILLLPMVLIAQESGKITVQLENLLATEGQLIVSLHTQDTFMKTAGVQYTIIEKLDLPIAIELDPAPAGEYAVIILHDINGNGKMDYDLYGRPKEPYTSSGPTAYGGPPVYEDAKFSYSGGMHRLQMKF